MTLHIRQAQAADLDAVAPLFEDYRRFYRAPAAQALATAFIGERLRRQDSVLLVAGDDEDARTVRGFAQLYPSFSSIQCSSIYVLNDLYVAETSRRRGVGRALLAAACSRARRDGAARLVLETAVDNRAAQALYEAFGFERGQGFVTYALAWEG